MVWEDSSTGSDIVSITIQDPDYVFLGDARLLESTPCKVQAGYTTDFYDWVDGYVSAVDVDFPEEGFPSLTLHIMDKSYVMNKLERKKVYKNLSRNAIAGQIAKRYGLKFSGDSSGDGGKKVESITQSYETDIQFLISQADEIGFLVYVYGDTLFFKNRETFIKKPSVGTLWYRKEPFDIINFQPRIIQADQMDELEEEDIDDKKKEKTKGKVTNTKKTNNVGKGGGSTPPKKTAPKAPAKKPAKTPAKAPPKSTNPPKPKPQPKPTGKKPSGKRKFNPYTGKWELV